MVSHPGNRLLTELPFFPPPLTPIAHPLASQPGSSLIKSKVGSFASLSYFKCEFRMKAKLALSLLTGSDPAYPLDLITSPPPAPTTASTLPPCPSFSPHIFQARRHLRAQTAVTTCPRMPALQPFNGKGSLQSQDVVLTFMQSTTRRPLENCLTDLVIHLLLIWPPQWKGRSTKAKTPCVSPSELSPSSSKPSG